MDDRCARCRRQGFSLVEVCLTIAILAVLIYVLISSIMSVARSGKRAADLLAEAVVARSAMCQVRDALVFNPAYIRHLESDYGFARAGTPAGDELTSFGTVTALATPPATPAGALAQSPYFRRLLPAGANPAAGALLPPGVELKAEERAELEASLANFAVKVRLVDAPRPLDFLGVRYGDRGLKEMIRKVTIDVYRLSEAGPGWAPAYTATENVLSPVESLSLDATLDLNESLKSPPLGQVAADIVARLRTKPRFAGYDDQAIQIAARIFLIYQEVNVEALLSDGAPLVPATTVVPAGALGLTQQFAALASAQSTFLIAKRGALHERQALVIYQAFQRSLLALTELQALQADFEAQIAAARPAADALVERARALVRGFAAVTSVADFQTLVAEMAQVCVDYSGFLTRSRALLLKAKLFEFLFTDPEVRAAILRTQGYSLRMTGALTQSQDIYFGLASGATVDPGPRARALLRYVEVCQASRILEAQVALPSAMSSRLGQMKSTFATGFPTIAEYLAQSDVNGPLDVLQRRFFGFAGTAPTFMQLGTPQNPLLVTQAFYLPGGGTTSFIDQVSRVPGNLVRAAWNLGGAAANVGLAPAAFNQALAQATVGIGPAIEALLQLGLTNIASINAGAPPSQAARADPTPFDATPTTP